MCNWRASGKRAEHVISYWWNFASQALAKGQMRHAENPWLPGATEPTLEASMETWQNGIQQQQEPHVFWAPALSLCVHAPCKHSSLPWGHIPPWPPRPPVLIHPLHSAPLRQRHPRLLHKHTPGCPSLLPLRSGGVGRESVTPTSSAAAVAIKMNSELGP